MAESELTPPMIVNMYELPEQQHYVGQYGAAFMALTPSMQPRGGKLGVKRMRLEKGQTTCPFHYHLREDEVFIVLEGMGVLRYGDALSEIVAGDCIACPAGTRIAHQIANPYDADLIYLAIGPHEPHDVCVYPDSDKISVRGVQMRGQLTPLEYFEGEPDPPRIFESIPPTE